MKRYAAAVLLLLAGAACAQEPALTHGQFGFQPKDWEGSQLTEVQKKELDECVAYAAKQTGTSKEDRAARDTLYGLQAGRADFYGAILSGCLADEQQGKGWLVFKRSGQEWEPVKARYALRSFMGLDPSK